MIELPLAEIGETGVTDLGGKREFRSLDFNMLSLIHFLNI